MECVWIGDLRVVRVRPIVKSSNVCAMCVQCVYVSSRKGSCMMMYCEAGGDRVSSYLEYKCVVCMWQLSVVGGARVFFLPADSRGRVTAVERWEGPLGIFICVCIFHFIWWTEVSGSGGTTISHLLRRKQHGCGLGVVIGDPHKCLLGSFFGWGEVRTD